MSIDDLVSEFRECVGQQSACIEQGDAATGNAYAKRYVRAFQKLRNHGDVGRDALASLMDDLRADVRVMAAACLLRHSCAKAMAVLRAEATKTGIVAFGAQEALKRWTEGTWALDPE